MNFVQVAIPSPLRQTFTYINNSGSDLLGKRVLVEFGRRKLVGIVTDNTDIADGKYKLKNIIEVLDETPLFSTEAIKKIIYISEHYMHPLGMVIESFIPTFLRKAKYQRDLDKYLQVAQGLTSATNLHKLVNSLFIFNLLQYLSINDKGVVLFNCNISLLVLSLLSISFIIETAFLHPLVALVLSKLNISAISFEVLG